MMKRNGTWVGLPLLAVLLISGWQPAASAEETVGQITAVDSVRGIIEINQIPFEVQGRNGGELQSRIRGMKPGQVVRFETDGMKLIRINPTKEDMDFPRLMGTPPAR